MGETWLRVQLQYSVYLVVSDFLLLRPQSFRIRGLPRLGRLLLGPVRFGGFYAPLKETLIRDTCRRSVISRCSEVIRHGYRKENRKQAPIPTSDTQADISRYRTRKLRANVTKICRTAGSTIGHVYRYADSAELNHRLLSALESSPRKILSTKEERYLRP